MPEAAEIRIMRDFINESCFHKSFYRIRKSEISKNEDPSAWPIRKDFNIFAYSRGKELMICVYYLFLDCPERTIVFTMGMSGNWVLVPYGEEPKHSHFMLDRLDGMVLCLVDPRRFAKWHEGSFSKQKGPCIIDEIAKLKDHVMDNLDKKVFDKPIYEALLDQRYFNGMGNYLRCTVLYYMKKDPFVDARTYIKKNPNLFRRCHFVALEAYKLGGGQLMTWKNPFSKDNRRFLEWVYYKKGECIKDSNGRNFWYDPKYKR